MFVFPYTQTATTTEGFQTAGEPYARPKRSVGDSGFKFQGRIIGQRSQSVRVRLRVDGSRPTPSRKDDLTKVGRRANKFAAAS
jgi:hypothetical protein